MTAPTEAEIRKAAQKALDNSADVQRGPDVGWIYEQLRPLAYLGGEDAYLNRSLWDDLRPSQVDRLNELMDAIYEKADVLMLEVAARVTEYVVEAAMTFAAEHPDAPRAKREAVPA